MNTATWLSWLEATRPKTLVASILPVLIGHMLSLQQAGSARWSITLLASVSAICIQIGTNLFNDVIDFKGGVDNAERKGPKRLLAAGLASAAKVRLAAHTAFALATAAGIPLVLRGGSEILVLGLASLICGYGYSGYPLRLSYRGLAEPFVIFFFGIAAVCGITWLQFFSFPIEAIILGTQVGLLATVLLVVNNIRDHAEDRAHGKLTLVARFGHRFGQLEVICCYGLVALLSVTSTSGFSTLQLLFLVPAAFVCSDVLRLAPGPSLNGTLAKAALTHGVFCTAIITGLLLDVRS